MIKPGDSIYATFTVSDSTGALVDADSLPTATIVKNGADDGAVTLTVTNVSTGRYKVTGTVPDTYVGGDSVEIYVAATVASVSGGVVVRSFIVDELRVQDSVVRMNTAQSGTVDGITLDASASSVTNFYKGCQIRIIGGTGVGQTRLCNGYDGTTKLAGVTPDWATTPDNTSVFEILPNAYVGGIDALTVDALADYFTIDSGQTYGAAVDGSVVKEIATNAGAGASFPANFSSLSIDASGNVSLGKILGTALTEGSSGRLSNGFKTFFGEASPVGTQNLIPQVTLCSTLTTYTGNTPQTGDAYSRIGANGGGLTNLGDTRLANLDAAISSRLAAADYSAPLNAASTAAAVWNATMSSYVTAGSTGNALNAAGGSGDPWSTTLPGSYSSGQAGKIIGDYIDAAISTRSTYAGGAVASVTGNVGGSVGSVAGNVDGNVTGSVGSVTAGVTLADNAITSAKIAPAAISSSKFSVAAITGVATGILEKIDQNWRHLFKKSTLTATELKTYADDGTTVLTTQNASDDGTTQTLGSAS
jgi:hypothetical protein